MITGLKPYPAVKPSGVDWLGDVPEHWDVRRIKQICRFAYGDSLPADMREEGRVPVFGSNGRVGYHSTANTKAPCLLIGRKGSFGKVLFSPSAAFAIDTAFYIDERLSNANLRWLLHLFSCLNLDDVTKDSAIPGLDRDETYGRRAPFPPLDEQAAIVRYLDHADRRISRYIRAKQRLIELLEEEKQAIIHRAVTRSLDPDVRLKPSGVEWLGDVPEHWEVRRLKHVLQELIDCKHKTAPAVGASSYRVVRTSAVRGGSLLIDGTYCTSEEAFAEWTKRGIPEPGDVIFTREAPAGEACVVPSNLSLCLGQRTVLMKVDRDVYEPLFLVHMLYAGPPQHEIGLASRGSTVAHFNVEDIGVLPVITPPVSEQAAIVGYLDHATADLDKDIDRARREIELLGEYRTRLIADVVTGKLDVKEAAAALPEVDPPYLEDTIEIDDVAADELDAELEEVVP